MGTTYNLRTSPSKIEANALGSLRSKDANSYHTSPNEEATMVDVGSLLALRLTDLLLPAWPVMLYVVLVSSLTQYQHSF